MNQLGLTNSLKFFLPRAIAFMLLLISFLPLNINNFSYYVPLFHVMIIFYWSIYYPKIFPKTLICLLGLFQDILAGFPLGMCALTNFILAEIIASQRKIFFKASFIEQWLGFLILALVDIIIKWLIIYLLYSNTCPITLLTLQLLITFAFYPLMHNIFNYLYLILPNSNNA